jgi:tetratricopeptide (TPR) repeat protein
MQGKLRQLFVIFIVLIAGCSTEKNTPARRAYHNLTAFYNIYFNGMESFQEGLERYKQQYQDDYSQLLPVFIYGEPGLHQSIKPQMERVVEKSSKAIRLHSITVKPDAARGRLSPEEKAFYNQSEYNKYVDDSYLLIAKALFYQMDYVASAKTLEYILNEYSDSSLLIDAKIWLARTHLQRKDYSDALGVLKSLSEEEHLSDGQKTAFRLTYAAYYVRQNKLKLAEEWLELSLVDMKDRFQSQRINYILGQLAVEFDEPRKAKGHFEKVLKLRPPYYMEFNANIQIARLSSGSNSRTMIARLEKMLRDDKNRDYQDQIYYALGQIYLRNNDRSKAVEHFKKAAYYSVQNKNQKGLAYLTLAQLYFEDEAYRNAQAYYDSAVTSLEKDYPGYADLYRKNENLTELVTNLIQVETQDSLLKLAAMPESERKRVVSKMINELRAQDRAEEQRKRTSGGLYSPGQNRQLRTQGSNEGKWYFYNPNAKSFGEPEFKRRWGDRTLEDNWRRRDKQVVAFSGELTEEQAAAKMEEQLKKEERYNPENYLKNIPLTDSAKHHAEFLIREGLYNAAHVYYSQLNDVESAVNTYEELLNRYQQGAYVLPTHYQLFTIFTEQGNTQKATEQKQIILTKFSDTQFAEVLRDPNYFRKFRQKEEERQKAYEQVLSHYQQGDYNKVVALSDKALQNPLLESFHPKYAFLKALSTGKLQGNATLIQKLEEVNKQYPRDPVAKQSEELIAFIQKDELKKTRADISKYQQEAASRDLQVEEQLKDEPVVNTVGKYSYEPEALHYFVLVVGKQVNLNQLRFNLINFNLDYYLQEDYNVSDRQLNEYSQLLIVKKFDELEKARDYFFTFDAKQDLVFQDVKNDGYQYFIISVDNYVTLTAERSISDYLQFFQKAYLEQTASGK